MTKLFPVAAPVGVVFGSLTPPELLAGGAALAERLGFADLWFSEDCFFTGAMSGLTQLLASTVSAPGRVSATLGLGNTHWLDQLGLGTERPLSTLLAAFGHLRDLLAGRSVTSTEGHVFRDVRLEFPPAPVPPLWLGAVNARALRAAGVTADGVLLSVISGPRYVRLAVEQVRAGAATAGRPAPPVVAFVLASVDPDPAQARANVRDAVAFFAQAEAHTSLLTRSSLNQADVAALEAGDPDRAEAMINELAAAGTAEQVTLIAEQVLPGVRSPESDS